jgi:hypothetical protein
MQRGSHLLDLVARERRVARRQEMAPRSWNETGNNRDEVVIHVARVTERLRRSRHDSRTLRARIREKRVSDSGSRPNLNMREEDSPVGSSAQS